MTERRLQYAPPVSTPDKNLFVDKPLWQRCGAIMAEYLRAQHNPTLLLDMDGVVFQADSLDVPRLTTPDIIPVLSYIEELGVRIGTATARSTHVVDYLRDLGLRLQGPAILEEGQVVLSGEEAIHLTLPTHKDFMKTATDVLSAHTAFESTWEAVQENARKGTFSFCHGNYQWQGEYRSSFWFSYRGNQDIDHRTVAAVFEPTLRDIADLYGLAYEKDIAIATSRMAVNNLAIVTIKGQANGQPIHKGMAAEKLLQGSWIFVADGFGDTSLAIETRRRTNGAVIGIEGNLDISNDVPEFLRSANAVLETPQDFVQSLQHTAYLLSKARN